MKAFCLLFTFSFILSTLVFGDIRVIPDVPYKTGTNLSADEQGLCKLDLYLPAPGSTKFPILVWFHGGGLEGGDKKDAARFGKKMAELGIAVASVNYRLSPKVHFPDYLLDSAAAVAWTHQHITEYGGDPAQLFIGGHSAGGWITLMLGLDDEYLKPVGIQLNQIAGLIPISGQVVTHYTVRKEEGLGKFTITADKAAPVYYAQKETPPLLMLYAEHDNPTFAEGNVYFISLMKAVGNDRIKGFQIPNRTHGSIADKLSENDDPAAKLIIDFIRAPGSVATLTEK